MEETYTTKAIILNRKPFREFDSKITVYSFDKGKLELVARGAKKIKSKLAGHLEPISFSDLMVVRGRRYDYVGSAVSRDCCLNLKSDLNKLICAGKAIGLFNRFVKTEERDERLFNALEYFLGVLNREPRIADYELFYYFFTLKLLDQLGYKPELYNCVVCGNKITPNKNKFNLNKGGLICADCQTCQSAPLIIKEEGRMMSLPISTDCIKILRFAFISDLDKIIKLKINGKLAKETIKIIGSFLKFHS